MPRKKSEEIIVKSKVRYIGILMALPLLAGMLTGCVVGKAGREKQKQWVEEMNKTFKDTHFEYVGPEQGEFGAEANIARMKADDGLGCRVKKLNGKLLTDYNYYRYVDDVDEYFYDYFGDWVEDICDSYEVSHVAGSDDIYSPLEDISAEEYIEKYVDCDTVYVFLYEPSGDFLSEDEMRDLLINVCKDREEACVIKIYWYTEKPEKDDRFKTYVEDYSLYMKEKGTIRNIYHNYKDPAKEDHYVLQDYKI